MQLNTSYEPQIEADGDRLKPSEIAGHPLIVKVHEHRTGITTTHNPDGDAVAVRVDVLDLTNGQVSINVLWFNGAIVDNLVGYVGGDPVAIKLSYRKSKSGNDYLVPEALVDADLQSAIQWAQARPTIFEDARAERGIVEGPASHLPPMGGAAPAPAAAAPAPAAAAPAPQATAAPQAAPAAPPAAFGPDSNPAPAAQPQQAPMPVQPAPVDTPF